MGLTGKGNAHGAPLGNIKSILCSLASKRPIFHSEADFQHALAWEIQKNHPEWSIRLEYPPHWVDSRIHLDLWIQTREAGWAIELKYLRKEIRTEVSGEVFDLRAGTRDIDRYDALKDIQRLETVVDRRENTSGFALILSNDAGHWNQPKKLETIDSELRIHEGKTITGKLAWSERAGNGSTKGREAPIVLRGTYSASWNNYSEPTQERNGKFRYLLFDVR